MDVLTSARYPLHKLTSCIAYTLQIFMGGGKGLGSLPRMNPAWHEKSVSWVHHHTSPSSPAKTVGRATAACTRTSNIEGSMPLTKVNVEQPPI
jgi:hypothetical protein